MSAARSAWRALMALVAGLLLVSCAGIDEPQLDAGSAEFANATPEDAALISSAPD